MEHQYRYDFSVVMAVWNVKDYIREAVESLISQTIGFSRIQVILVDDGSTDGSGAVCDEYHEKYPGNVLVIHKENGRQASARNAGLPFVEGKYVSFLDPDDTLDHDAMEKVRAFMDTHEGLDICCIPMFYFGDREGPHALNNKFRQGTRVIDLLNEDDSEFFLMSAASAFYRNQTAREIEFDTEIYHAEDARENIRILMDKPLLGVVSDTRYNYRRHAGSTVSNSRKQKGSYLVYLKHFSLWAFERARQKYGRIPLFVQNMVMYDLQWKLIDPYVPEGVLTEEEAEEYNKLLIRAASEIDDDIILRQRGLSLAIKLHILREKYGYLPELTVRGKKMPCGNRGSEGRVHERNIISDTGRGILASVFMFLVLRFLFTRVFGQDTSRYSTYLFAGILMFSYFREGAGAGMRSLVSNENILLKINVPKEMFFTRGYAAALISFGAELVLLFVIAALDGVPFCPAMAGVIYAFAMLSMLNIGLGMVVSALYIFSRNMRYLYEVLMMILLFVSAVFCSENVYPGWMRKLFLLNPVYCSIKYVRTAVLEGHLPSPAFHFLLFLYGVLALLAGRLIFKAGNRICRWGWVATAGRM